MPENQTGNVESDALAEIERRCRFLAPTTPMAAVLAIVRDVLTRVTPPAEPCPYCGRDRGGEHDPICPASRVTPPAGCTPYCDGPCSDECARRPTDATNGAGVGTEVGGE